MGFMSISSQRVSATPGEGSLPAGHHRPLVAAVLDLLENAAAASPPFPLQAFYFFHLVKVSKEKEVPDDLPIGGALRS